MSYEANFEDQQDTGTEGPPWKLLALLVLVIALAVFFLQNGQRADVEFLWLDGSWPVWVVIGISVLVGVLLDRLVGWQVRRSRRRRRAAARPTEG